MEYYGSSFLQHKKKINALLNPNYDVKNLNDQILSKNDEMKN